MGGGAVWEREVLSLAHWYEFSGARANHYLI